MGEVLITRRPDPHAELGYECPECKAWSPVSMWKATEVGREACGDHAAMQCPLCGVSTDTVFTDFEEPDHFLEAEARKAGRPPGMPTPEEQVQHLKLFLAAADDRLRKAQAEAAALTVTPLSTNSCCNSPAWNISRMMSQPPTNSPLT